MGGYFLLTHTGKRVLYLVSKLLAAVTVEAVAAAEEALFACAGCDGYNAENDCKKQNQHQYLDFNTNSFHFYSP